MDSSNGNKLTSVGDDRTCAGSTKSIADEKAVKLNDIQDQSNSCLVSEGTKPVFDHDIRGGTVKPEDESRKGLFNWIVKCRFWRNDTESGERKSQSFHQVVNDEVKMKPETHDLFSKDHFWDSMESFLHTAKGLSLISRSESRERLATELQKEGPLVLNALKPNHLLKLVDILISDKKWVEENASQPSPFKLTIPPKSSNAPSQDVSSRGLSSFFSNRSKSNFQRNSDYNKGKEHNNPDLIGNSNAKLPQNMSELISWFSRIDDGPGNIQAEDFKMYYERDFNKKLDTGLYGFSSVENLLEACLSDNASTPRSSGGRPPRAQILLDCQKLLAEILEKNPNGFNISRFRSLFAERYGYVLDHQALGYRKLLSLLRIMPGVKVYADFIFPARAFHMKTSDSEGEIVAVSAGDSEHEDNTWEELGPISDKGVSEKREQSRVGDSSVQSIEDYEPSLCEEDFSGSEGESPISVDQLEEHKKQKGGGEEDSSLLQILDSWYSNKDGSGKNAVVDVSSVNNSVSKPIDPLIRNLDFQRAVTNRGQKPKRRKTYSFVSDDEKEKLVDGILGSLKRSAGS
ncbi:hypothetical protein QJS10_CPB13g01379 [Acorus calamus]|uniref:HTH OST-type domain-containing protein n=1 Tax=Acorus calamus TaxID=4465 RepID=A0AAV9DGR6_ACOCL|nr:hypothetical protein QJS10_CPB13g01379 [Acorus calamus]